MGRVVGRLSGFGARRSVGLLIAVAALAGCAGRPGPEVLNPVAAVHGAKPTSIYVATTRTRDVAGRFTNGRASGLNFAHFTVLIPPGHQPGNIEWPSGATDARTTFATTGQSNLSAASFRDAVAPAGKAPRGTAKRKVLVFVHGYNNTFQESLFRVAQIHSDAGVNGEAVLFSWPSQGSVTDYLVDRDSVAYSRDYLVDLLSMVTASPQVGDVDLVAHSMGGWLTVEALRQLRIAHRDDVIKRLHRVILAAPDIDVDVFRSEIRTIGPLSPPMIILVSKDDFALRASSFFAGSRSRVGALDVNNPAVREAALAANVQIIDISGTETKDSTHNRFVGLAALYPRLESEASSQTASGNYLLNAVSLKLQSATGAPAASR
jgi:esterase/lipase superfamily enzyme